VAVCPICEKEFDERVYQLVLPGLGTFDSIGCGEEAARRSARAARGELAPTLLEAVSERLPGARECEEATGQPD
jgi:hypothetical protein